MRPYSIEVQGQTFRNAPVIYYAKVAVDGQFDGGPEHLRQILVDYTNSLGAGQDLRCIEALALLMEAFGVVEVEQFLVGRKSEYATPKALRKANPDMLDLIADQREAFFVEDPHSDATISIR